MNVMAIVSRWGKLIFLAAAATVVAVFLYVSNLLVADLAARERERMEIWADATKEIVSQLEYESQWDADNSVGEDPGSTTAGTVMHAGPPVADINFLLRIIEGNTSIPVLLTDGDGNILNHRNFDLPDAAGPDGFAAPSPANDAFLAQKLRALKNGSNVIHIAIAPGVEQHLYYEDSRILRRLRWYPYIQLVVMVVFLTVVYFAVVSSKKAEQNKVWVGLSKETAHQLGTPISSLMAWLELLPDMGVDPETCAEMDKDVKRLGMIASRFSKIGSRPQIQTADAAAAVSNAASYMGTRISPRIKYAVDIAEGNARVKLSVPLFEWVMENLIKNAVDAMQGDGSINVRAFADTRNFVVEVADTGKGIAARDRKNVFKPGYTTKKRGWGLGLTLAKRIIDEYHGGRIFVKSSTPGVGTVFRIELPLA